MCNGQKADIDHCFAETWLDHAIAHADDQKEEEGERVPSGVQDGHKHHQSLIESIVAVPVLVVVEAPGHQLLHDQEDDCRGNVILDG